MQIRYEEVAHRFREERERLKITQEEFCKKLYMSQGHYCKAEQGKNRFTYGELILLTKAGVDLHYVYTKERLSHPECYALFTDCDPAKAQCLAEMTLPLLFYSARSLPGREADRIRRRIRYIQCIILRDRQEDSYLYRLRRYKSYSQRYMAGLLGVDIKKYTSLETRKTFEDSEILLHIYNQFEISPLVILNVENGVSHEVCVLLELLNDKERSRYFECIRHASML